MAVRYDYALINNDIVFNNGDLYVVESDTQHCIDTINAFAGWWKENPLDGVGIMAYTKSPADRQEIGRKMQVELKSDGYVCRSPTVTLTPDGQLSINPNIQEV